MREVDWNRDGDIYSYSHNVYENILCVAIIDSWNIAGDGDIITYVQS